MTAFAILSQPRTGSKMLRTALASHPCVHCAGEVFSRYAPSEFPTDCVRNQFHDAKELLDHIWLKPDVGASGFVLHDEYRAIWPPKPHEAIARYPQEVVVIWLSRRDKLAQFISWKVAKRTAQWARTDESVAQSDVSIRVDIDEMTKWYWRLSHMRRRRHRLLRTFKAYSIEYEDLLLDLPGQLSKICHTLGVEPRPMAPSTFRQQERPLEHVIENYADARQTMTKLTGIPN